MPALREVRTRAVGQIASIGLHAQIQGSGVQHSGLNTWDKVVVSK